MTATGIMVAVILFIVVSLVLFQGDGPADSGN